MNKTFLDLHEKAKASAQRFHQAQAELIKILQAIDRHQVFLKLGYSSLYAYALEELKLSESHVTSFIAVSRKAQEVPELLTSLEAEEITLSNARKIAPVLTPQNSVQWLERARTLSKRALEKEIARVYPKTEGQERAYYLTGDRLRLEVSLNEEVLRRLIQIQQNLSTRKKKRCTMEEVIEIISREYHDRHDPVARAERREKREKKQREETAPAQEIQDCPDGKVGKGFPHPLEAEHHANLPSPGKVSWQFQRSPLPLWLRHEVVRRDNAQCTYVYPNGKRCRERYWLQIHHILAVSRGGSDALDNLRSLCPNHHRLIHCDTGWQWDQRQKKLVFRETSRQGNLGFVT